MGECDVHAVVLEREAVLPRDGVRVSFVTRSSGRKFSGRHSDGPTAIAVEASDAGLPVGAGARIVPAATHTPAGVAELVYANDSKSFAGNGMRVRFPPSAWTDKGHETGAAPTTFSG